MANRRHHYSCRCNDCVRQRNARRRRSEERYADQGNPLPSGATWYEVPENHPVRYADDGRPQDDKQVQAGIGGTQQTEFAPPDHEGQDAMQPPAGSAQQTEIREPLISDQRDDWKLEQERQLQGFLRQQEERQQDWDRRREQLRSQHSSHMPTDIEEFGPGAVEPPSDNDGVPVSTEQAHPDAPLPITATRRNARRNLLTLLVVSFLTLAIVTGIGMLVAYVVLYSPRDTAAAEVVEPTPDLEATITAAVAAAFMQTPFPSSPDAQPDAANTSNGNSTATGPEGELPYLNPPMTNGPPTDPYVEWIREPKVSESGVMGFRARIDDRAGFVVAGAHCGFPNATLTDGSDALYGVIIPRRMADACAALPGQRITDQYAYFSNLLIVRLQIDPVTARRPGLTLCLWKGGMTEELLDCVPVKQP